MALRLPLRNFVLNAFRQVPEKLTPAFQALGESMEGDLRSRTAFKRAHQEMADFARVAVLESYVERVESQKEFASYRFGQNRFPGALRSVLQDENSFRGTPGGVQIGFMSAWDKVAPHWRRLNFGTVGINPDNYSETRGFLRIGSGVPTKAIPLFIPGDYRPPVYIPPGVFVKGGETRPSLAGKEPGFYPIRSRPMTLTGGIGAYRFLDAAAVAIGEEAPVIYQDLVAELVDRALRTGQGAGTNITVLP